ncbi:MAG: DUF2723 domain-containing protein [Spirochaetes bacterium]|nr:DUF2723 domain-containing protein [Spirochaetota bacterium]
MDLISKYRIHTFTRIDLLVAAIMGILTTALYTYTMTPTVSAGDSGELIVAIHFLGIAHAPCYPLYSYMGKLMTFLPIESIGWRANFFSSFCGGLIVFFSVLVFIKLLASCGTRALYTRIAAAIVGAAWATSGVIWSARCQTRATAMSAVFFPVLLLILLRWQDEVIERNSEKAAVPYFGEKYLLAFAMLFGFAMGGHQTILGTAGFGFMHIVTVLLIFVVAPRRLSAEQILHGLGLLATAVVVLAIAYGVYYKFIVSLDSNLYDTNNVKIGMITFIVCNLALLGVYLFYKFLAPDLVDPHNPLQRGFFVLIKMFMMFYLGYAILLYMIIRAHGNPPINWMGINEVEDWWLKFGKFFNAIWRKQYGNMGILPLSLEGLPMWFGIAITKLNGPNFTVIFWLFAAAGAVSQFFKDRLWFFLSLWAIFSYNVIMTLYLRYYPDDRALSFIKDFYVFSYWACTIPMAYGVAWMMEGMEKGLGKLTGAKKIA